MGCILFYVAIICGMIHASVSIKSNGVSGNNNECSVEKLVLIYNSGVSVCKQGEIFQLPLVSSSQPPSVKYTFAKPSSLYTIIMVDLDAPTAKNPIYAPWLHWIVADIDGTQLKTGTNPSTGHEIVEYNPPTPPANTSYHRYVFKLYVQLTQDNQTYPTKKRSNFDEDEYVKKYGLEFVTKMQFVTKSRS